MSEPTLKSNSTDLLQKNTSPAAIRSATEADVPFIFNSWLKSYRGAPAVQAISNTVYFQFEHKAIEKLLQKSQVLIACDPADANQLYGYIVFQIIDGVLVVHYAYIKHSFRKMGLLRLLTSSLNLANGGFFTYNTLAGSKLAAAKKFVYNPYLAYGVL